LAEALGGFWPLDGKPKWRMVFPLPDTVRPQHSAASMGQQSNKVEKKKRRLAYLERKKERVKKAIVGAKKASRK
jgi:hypothetical protein